MTNWLFKTYDDDFFKPRPNLNALHAAYGPLAIACQCLFFSVAWKVKFCLYATFQRFSFKSRHRFNCISYWTTSLYFFLFNRVFNFPPRRARQTSAPQPKSADLQLFSLDAVSKLSIAVVPLAVAFRHVKCTLTEAPGNTLNPLARDCFHCDQRAQLPLGPRALASRRSFAALSRGPWKSKQMFHTFAIGATNKKKQMFHNFAIGLPANWRVKEERAPVFYRLGVNSFIFLDVF